MAKPGFVPEICGCSHGETCISLYVFFFSSGIPSAQQICVVLPLHNLITKANSLVTHFRINSADNVYILSAASSSGMGVQESTAQQMVSDPTLVHVLVRFLSGGNPHGTIQHSSQVLSVMKSTCMTGFMMTYLENASRTPLHLYFQVGPTATQALQEFLTRLQVHLSSTCPQMFSEFLLKLLHILSTER